MRFKPLFSGGLVVAVLAAVLFVAARDVEATFAPSLVVEITDPTAETPSDFVSQFNLPENDVNFAAVVAFIPPEWGVVPGDQMPIGTPVGSLAADSTLGLFGGNCNQKLPVFFEFVNASLDPEDTVSFQDTDKTDDDTTADYAKDVDNNGLYDAFDKYPDFLNRIFDEPIQPIRRSAGIQIVAGIPVLLQFLVFEPGTVINDELPSDATRGFPSVTVLQAVGDPDAEPAPSAITDFCTPLATVNTTLGVSEDVTLFVNPQDGVYTFSTVSFGQRDADGDGYENSLDTCALKANIGNPRVSLDGDLDNDGLDAACDPNDNAATGGTDSDQDADGYQNRQDNCPLDPNGQTDDNQADEDRDQIGDTCDPDAAVENGDLSFSDLAAEVTIGAGGEGGSPACAAEGGADGVECWYEGYVLDVQANKGSSTQPTDTPGTDEPTPDGPSGSPTATPIDDDDGGSNSGVIIGVVVAAIAAVAIIGGGLAMMRKRNDGA